MNEPSEPRTISAPIMQYDKLRDPVKRLALMLTVNNLNWLAFTRLDDEKRALLLCEAQIGEAEVFQDACDQLAQLVRGKQTIAVARSKGAGQSGVPH